MEILGFRIQLLKPHATCSLARNVPWKPHTLTSEEGFTLLNKFINHTVEIKGIKHDFICEKQHCGYPCLQAVYS